MICFVLHLFFHTHAHLSQVPALCWSPGERPGSKDAAWSRAPLDGPCRYGKVWMGKEAPAGRPGTKARKWENKLHLGYTRTCSLTQTQRNDCVRLEGAAVSTRKLGYSAGKGELHRSLPLVEVKEKEWKN